MAKPDKSTDPAQTVAETKAEAPVAVPAVASEVRNLRSASGGLMYDPFTHTSYGALLVPEVKSGWVDAQIAAGKLIIGE